MYKGLVPVLSSLYCSNFVYFYTFHGIKKILRSQEVKQRPALDLILGYFAGNAFHCRIFQNSHLIQTISLMPHTVFLAWLGSLKLKELQEFLCLENQWSRFMRMERTIANLQI